jgi:hypothetical protein
MSKNRVLVNPLRGFAKRIVDLIEGEPLCPHEGERLYS